LILFGTDQQPEHGMNSDSRKSSFIHSLFFLCLLGTAELSLGLSYQASLWTGMMPNYLGAKYRQNAAGLIVDIVSPKSRIEL
jgi:hypothetical protein